MEEMVNGTELASDRPRRIKTAGTESLVADRILATSPRHRSIEVCGVPALMTQVVEPRIGLGGTLSCASAPIQRFGA